MKNIIKQIEKIKGVVTVEKAGENMAIVVFEPEPKPQEWAGREYVECTTEEQFEFVKNKTGLTEPASISYWVKYPCVSTDGKDCFSSQMFPERSHRIIDFGKYVSNRNIQGEWRAFNKPKSLSPDELVDGKIYVTNDDNDDYVMIFRYKSFRDHRVSGYTVNYYSLIGNKLRFSVDDWCEAVSAIRILRHATQSEAQSLIRAEIEHGYFHELKDVK